MFSKNFCAKVVRGILCFKEFLCYCNQNFVFSKNFCAIVTRILCFQRIFVLK